MYQSVKCCLVKYKCLSKAAKRSVSDAKETSEENNEIKNNYIESHRNQLHVSANVQPSSDRVRK